jgi:D-alanine transaminase
VVIVPEKIMLTEKVRLLTLEDTRYLFCNAKALNILFNCLAAEKAKRAGCYEAVLHRGNKVTECTPSNIHIVSAGKL